MIRAPRIPHALLALAQLVTMPILGQAQDPGILSRKVLPSVVAVRVERPDGTGALGTGFLGLKEGMLVTALLPLRDARKVTAIFANGEEFECSGLVDKDERRNLALIRIKSFGRPMLPVGPGEIAPGAKVFCPVVKEGAFGIVESGVAEVVVKGGVKFYFLSQPLPQGNSGSPVVDERGEVLGIHMTVVVNDKDQDVAVPAAYALALEASLPVLPWTGSGAQPGATTQKVSATDAALDAEIASALLLIHETFVGHLDLSARIYSITRYGHYPIDALYQTQMALDTAASQLGLARTSDPVRAKLVQATGQLLAKGKNALELEISCATLNKDTSPSQAVPQAEAAALRAHALIRSMPDQVRLLWPDLKQLAGASPEPFRALPVETRYFLGQAERRSRLALGALVAPRNPFFMTEVMDKELADKLGLRGGDLIVSAGGRTFGANDDLEDFKLLLEAKAGTTLEVVVQRRGKIKTLQASVPADVVTAYPLAAAAFPRL